MNWRSIRYFSYSLGLLTDIRRIVIVLMIVLAGYAFISQHRSQTDIARTHSILDKNVNEHRDTGPVSLGPLDGRNGSKPPNEQMDTAAVSITHKLAESREEWHIAKISMDSHTTARFFRMKPQQILDFPKPDYLPQSRNPCFYADISSIPYLSDAEKQRRYRLTCLPAVYFFGVQKAGTSDFHTKLVQHQHIVQGIVKEPHFWNINRPDKTRWYRMGYYTELYQYFSSMVDNCCLDPSNGCHVDDFTPGPTNVRVTIAQRNLTDAKIANYAYHHLKERVMAGHKCPLVTIDSTVRSIHDSLNWELDPRNQGLDVRKVLTAERLNHFVPNAKIIILLRDPIERAISDYRFFSTREKSAASFHEVVQNGIHWWKTCLSLLSEQRCSYENQFSKYELENLPDRMKWGQNGAAKLRVGMYILYIRRWLQVFPRDQLLVLNLGQVDKDPIKVFQQTVYPFLELEPMSEIAEGAIRAIMNQGHIHKTKSNKFEPSNATMEMLKDLYAPYNAQLAEFMADDTFLWI